MGKERRRTWKIPRRTCSRGKRSGKRMKSCNKENQTDYTRGGSLGGNEKRQLKIQGVNHGTTGQRKMKANVGRGHKTIPRTSKVTRCTGPKKTHFQRCPAEKRTTTPGPGKNPPCPESQAKRICEGGALGRGSPGQVTLKRKGGGCKRGGTSKKMLARLEAMGYKKENGATRTMRPLLEAKKKKVSSKKSERKGKLKKTMGEPG